MFYACTSSENKVETEVRNLTAEEIAFIDSAVSLDEFTELMTWSFQADSCASCLFDTGLYYYQKEDWLLSFKAFSIYILKDSTNAAAYANRASVFYQLTMYEDALEDYLRANEIQAVFQNQISHCILLPEKWKRRVNTFGSRLKTVM